MADPKKQAKNRTDAATLPLEKILAALPDARRSGAGWMARCPAHDDRTASLSISEGDNGRALIRCHAGCPAQSVVAAMGMTLADLMPPRDAAPTPRRSAPPAKKPGKTYPTMTAAADAALASMQRVEGRAEWIIAAVHEYRRTDGGLYAAVVRAEPPGGGEKDIRPIHAVPGGWAVGDPEKWTPYRIESLQAGLTFIVEGEKAADAGASIGLNVVTWSHGARAARQTDWSALAGRDVVVLPDNDGAGRDAMNDLGAILTALRCDVRVLTLDGLAEHGDLADWLAERDAHEPHELRDTLTKLAADAPKWEPSAQASKNPTAGPRGRENAVAIQPNQGDAPPYERRKLLVRAGDMINDARTTYLWHRRFPLGAQSVIFSRPGNGKSTLGASFTAHVTRGLPWPDGSPCPLGDVLYLKGEGTDSSIRDRMELAGADGSRYVVAGRTDDDDAAMIDLALDIPLVKDTLDVRPNTKLIIVDTLDSLFPSMRMIDNANIRKCLWPLQQLAEERQLAVMIFAHTNKGGYADPLDRLSGGRAIGGAARAIWYLGKTDPDADEFYMASVKCNDFRPVPTLTYSIVGDGPDRPGSIRWGAETDLTAWDLDGPPKSANEDKGEACKAWLTDLLKAGPVPVADVNRRAKGEGYGRRVLTSAKTELGAQTLAQSGTFPPVYMLHLPTPCLHTPIDP